MLLKILLLGVLCVGAVVSIYIRQDSEKKIPYYLDPFIRRALQRQRYENQGSEIVEQQERHAHHERSGQDYANNLDDYYGGCPSGFTGQLPYPYDCRRFVNCWKGRAYIQTCGPGTVFNAETLECDSPTKVVCQGLSALPKGSTEPTGNRLARLQQTVVANDDDVSCPPGYSGLLPHPNDCSKFLNCDRGFVHIQSCGPQTMYSTVMKVCDFSHKVDCSGRDGDSYSGNRGGKTFESNTRVNQPINQEVPQRKGWTHQHNHHHNGVNGGPGHHNHNCGGAYHHHQRQPPVQPVQPAVQTPILYRDRWASMNRTRPTAPGDRSTTQTTRPSATPNGSWTWSTKTNQLPSSWTPITTTTTTLQPTWQIHGNSGSSWTPATTVHPPSSNYPNNYYGNRPNRTDSHTNTTTTRIYYAQPVDNDQPYEEVFSNVYGGDVSEVSLPSHRRNVSRTMHFPIVAHSNQPETPHPSMDAINIPNINLMPPHPSSPSDDRQFQIPEQYPEYSSPYPSYTAPQAPRPPQYNPRPVVVASSRGDDHSSSPDEEYHPSMDAINIPSVNLMPPHRSSPTDDRPYRYPTETVPQPKGSGPSSFNRTTTVYMSSSPDGGYSSVDAINIPTINRQYTPNWQLLPSPDDGQTRVPEFENRRPGSRIFNTTTVFIDSTPVPDQQPTWIINDESNLFGGLLPPLPSASEQPTPPLQPSHPYITSTTPLPPPGVKTNVRVFQIYPPPAVVQNATTIIHSSPFYSPSYSGVAHSRNSTWSRPSIKTSSRSKPTPRSSATTFSPEDNFEPEIIFSQEGGVVIPSEVNRKSSTTTQRHGVLPPDYNREFYKQTTPSSVHSNPADTETSDDVGQMPISEAIRLLLRPYFNRSGTVTDDMAAKAESHIMSLSAANEPRTSTSSRTSTTTSTVAPEIHKDVEIVFTDEQNSLTTNYAHPIHSHVHSPPSKYHENQHHDRNFHRTHPHLPNPFANEPGRRDDSVRDFMTTTTTPRTWEAAESTTTEAIYNPAVDDVCQFDCGNGQCIKTFERCDGVNNCGNRRDEEQCDHLGYDIRLSNEDGGRVEVKILGHWGYVCDDKFGIQDANVVCRELGFPLGASEVHGNSFYPPAEDGELSFVMDELDCSGNETSLKDCPFMGWGVSDCGPDEVVGVQCKTPVMKCPNDYWLCSTSKECIPPAFVCDNVPDCSDQSDESIVVCNSTVEFRLKGGRGKQEGRLEILYRGVWGTICDDDFGQTEAQVACNSLGYYGPAKIVKNAFGPGSGPIWLDQVSCYGNESAIDLCHHWSWGEHNCNHTEDVSLKCTPGSPPRSTNNGIKGSPNSSEDVQTTTLDDIGMDLYPMERSSKFANTRKVCGHFNANLTEDIPRELERVVKGNVAQRGHHPWQATIRTKGRGGISSHWCGAVLISKKHLLTAAHCLVGYPKGAYFIRLGDHYANIAESSEIDSYIENWYIHEKFREGTHMNNDIAVIVMKNPVRFNDYIQPICLPREGTEYQEGRQCTISGWGSIQSGVSTPSNNLRVAQIPVISDEICKLPHVYGNSITEGMFCAGFLEEGVDACEGDSGGPFVCSDSEAETLYGIISWGQQCGHANKPGVYVKIEKYLDWIYEKIRFSMQQIN